MLSSACRNEACASDLLKRTRSRTPAGMPPCVGAQSYTPAGQTTDLLEGARANKFDEALLMERKQQTAIGLEDLRVQVIQTRDRRVHVVVELEFGFALRHRVIFRVSLPQCLRHSG